MPSKKLCIPQFNYKDRKNLIQSIIIPTFFHSYLINLHYTHSLHPFYRQSGAVAGHREKKLATDSTKTYSRRWFLRDVPQMRRYHDKII